MERILLVEDETAIAELTEKTLSALGYEFSGTALSGESAIREARKLKPALVLMDIGLQGSMDGIEAARRIHLDQDIPVIFLTAADDDRTMARAKVAEPLGYLVKPFEARNLHAAIEIALAQHKANQRRTEDAMQQAEERFRLKFENAVAGMFQAGSNGEFLQANRALAQILGYRSADELNAAVTNLGQVLNVKLDPTQGLATFCQKPGARQKFEIQAYRKDGSTVWMAGSACAIRDSRGEILYYEGSVMGAIGGGNEPPARSKTAGPHPSAAPLD